jgi:dTDP-4-amino-4,6-dideoxygalactose transaminase
VGKFAGTERLTIELSMTNTLLEETSLAVLGGKAAFKEPLHVGRPNIGDRRLLLSLVEQLLDRGWLTNNGPFVQEFEKRIADMLGVKHCIAVCNATIGLELAIRAADLKGEVIVPSFTFVATAHALQWQEITPVFCDVDARTHHIDPSKVERMITPRTTGIIGVHTWGRPCDTEALANIAAKRKLSLLFDAAHAFGCSHEGKMIGSFGMAEVLSFHATKFLNTFEGGAIVTSDDALAARIRLMKNFGFAGYDNVIYVGTNGKMPEVCAAMGLASLDSMEEFIAVNCRNYKAYRQHLARIPGISLLTYDESERCNYHYIVAEIDESITGVSRDQLVKVLHAENVLARRYFYPGCHRMEPYRSYFPHAPLLLAETERLANRVLILPNGTSVGPQEIEKICSIIASAIQNADILRERLEHRVGSLCQQEARSGAYVTYRHCARAEH